MPPKKTTKTLQLERTAKARQRTKAKAKERETQKRIVINQQADNIFKLRPTRPQIKKMLNNALTKKGINVSAMVHKTIVSIIKNYKNYKIPKKTRKPRKVKIINNVINTNTDNVINDGVENLDDDAQIDADYEYLLNKYGMP